MIQQRLFAIVPVAALLIAASLLGPSHDQSGAGGVRASEDAGAALVHAPTAGARDGDEASAALGPYQAAGAMGIDARWSADIASRIEREEYRVSQTAAGLQAPNRAHNLRTHFRSGGIDVGPRQNDERDASAAWRLTWRTTRWGRSNQLVDLESPDCEPRLDGERITYAKGAIDEWYENRKEGLEQGFTVHERPPGGGALIVAGQLGGGLRPRLSLDEAAIDLLDDHGARVLRYGELHVWDAEGTELSSHLDLDGIEVAIVIEDDGATYPLTIDPLLTSPSWTAESDQAGANFGLSVATAGDVNGDGFSDVIVGAQWYDNVENAEGRAYAYYGSAAGLAAAPAWTVESDQANALFGRTVATAGDVNGDGFSDVIVGSADFDSIENGEGRAFVYLGSATGLSTTAAWTAESDQAGAAFGFSVATAGDVNGDGFSDVIVGAWNYDSGLTDVGRAYVYHGSASGLSPAAAWTAESDETFCHFGSSVASAGDVNGDGYSDVIVGAPFDDNGQSDEGRVFVYHGSATGLSTTHAWVEESDQSLSWYAWTVSTAGDVNGDGYADVIVGAPYYDNGVSDKGRAYVYHGSALGLSTTTAWAVESGQAGASYGTSVAAAGDVNGDGYADVIVGAPYYDNGQTNEGRTSVYHGSAGGLSAIAAWTGESNQGGAQVGICVATAGDVNGDGFSDVIVGAYAYDNLQTDEGGAFVYHGSANEPDFPESWNAESNLADGRFGESVAPAGDVNGDGFTDVIVGSPYYDGALDKQGRASVFHGSATGLAVSPAWVVEGTHAVETLGDAVGTAGDVNGDGFSDVIVGAPRYGNVQTQEGRALVYLGSAAGLSPVPAWTVESNQEGATYGWSVGTAGDVNGDGYSDVIVGASNHDNVQLDEGRAFVYLGSAAGLATSPAWTIESDVQAAQLGQSVGTAGDVNGDGFSDVVVGVDRYYTGAPLLGRALVYHGSASGLSASPGWVVNGDQSSCFFGCAVGTAGDVNGDGFSDVIVGANRYDNGQSNEGRAYLYLGSSAGLLLSPSWIAESNQDAVGYGHSVGTAGDLNADGYSDVIVGAPEFDGALTNEGRAYVYFGSATGLAPLSAWSPTSGQASAEFGVSALSAGDVNGDGFSDVIIGAHRYDNFQTDEGRVFVYYGNDGDGLHRVPRQLRADGSAPIQALGRSNSPSAFRLEALGRAAAGRARVRLQYEVEPFGTPFDGAGLITGPVFDTGLPVSGVGSAAALSELASGLNAETLYRWRLRIVSDSPFFPRSPWLTLASNAVTEADLRTAPAGTGVGDAPSAPVATSAWLEPSAPNPFTTTTRLAYTLPGGGPVRLAVYDVSGREVAVLADEIQASGSYATTWDGRSASGRSLGAGVYFARLEFGGRVEARKIVLAR